MTTTEMTSAEPAAPPPPKGFFKRLFKPRKPIVAVVPMSGAIMANGSIGRAFDDAQLAPLFEKAFTMAGIRAVALAINCPGGSPVQSSMIGARIRRLADKYQVPVYAFCADVAASGGYWLACAADEIYADDCSIVGSIGVIAQSFGLHEAIGKLGVERRVHTAGGSKSFWDPFSPEKPEDVDRLLHLQGQMHTTFIDWVKSRRGDRLSDETELFDGSFWVGREAHGLGLVDGLGHLVPVMTEKFGDKTRFRVLARKKGLFARAGLPGADTLADEIAVRGLYARFGL
ncbi:MAG: S49 family peptidase [Pseudomonadota bacterium]